MSQSKIWLSPKDRILYALYKERNGLGFNELVQKYELHGKYVKVFADCKKGKLFKDGYIECKKVTGKGGVKDVRMITEKGVEYVERNIVGLEVGARNILMFAQARTEKEKFACLGLVFKDMFEYASSLFKSGKRLEMMRVFRDTIQTPVKEFLNKQVLEDKEYIAKFQNGKGTLPPDDYYDPTFILRQFPLAFIIRDTQLAWELNHYLNSHHVYLLTKLGIHTKEEISEKNKKWEQEHKTKTEEPFTERRDMILTEIEKRKKMLRNIGSRFVFEDYGKSPSDIS
jgi:hypothetical protein